MTHFTLVHGAWHGAWCWDDLIAILEARGHSATAVTLTGLGERAGELSASINLQTYVQDVIDHLEREDCRQTVLVGHSFGGNAITGAAAQKECRDRISKMIYLDAMVPVSGSPPCATVPATVWAERRKLAATIDGTLCFGCPPTSFFAIKDPEKAAYVAARLTPHPLRTYETAITFDGPPGSGLPCRYIMVTDPVYDALADHCERARSLGWPIDEIPCGHDAMIDAPEALAGLLEK